MMASVALRKLRLSPAVPAFTSDTMRSLLAMRSLSVTAPQLFYGGLEKPVVSGKRNLAVVKLVVNLLDHILRKADGHRHPVWRPGGVSGSRCQLFDS